MTSRLAKLTLLFFVVLLGQLVGARPAEAQKPWEVKRTKAYKVYIESAPDRAAVYVDDLKWGVFCYTPCQRVKLPYKTTYELIFVKEGFKEHREKLEITNKYWQKFEVRAVLTREIQPAIVDVQSDPSGNATGGIIYVDGEQKGSVPMKITVPPGRHEIRVERAGYTTHTQWVTVVEKQVWTIQAIMAPVAKPKGTIVVTSDVNDAEVFVGGVSQGKAPAIVKDLEAGPHNVEVRAPGASPWKQVVVVESGKITKVNAALADSVPKTGTLRVVCNVPGADVYVDGEKKGVAPLTVKDLIPGDHIVLVKSKGFLPKQVAFKIALNQQSLVTVDLEKVVERAPVGVLRVQADQPDAEVIVDGQRIGKAPIEQRNVPEGIHIVKVVKPGFLTHTEKVEIKKFQTFTLTAMLRAGGLVKITSNPPGATVYIDTKPVGQTPLMEHVLQAGTYTVDVELNGFHRASQSVTVQGGVPAAVHVDLEQIRTGPTTEELVRGLSSFGALAVPPGRFTSDVTSGWLPHFGRFRLTVGAYRGRHFGVDAGVSIAVQGFTNTFAVHGRFQLFRAGPFTAGAFTDLGGGPGYQSRNTFEWNIGAIASLSFRELVTVSLRLYGQVYRDQFCRSKPANPSEGESEPHWCAILDGDDAAAREYELSNNVPSRWEGKLRSSDDAHRKGFTGGRFMMSLFIEVALHRALSLHLELTGAPGMDQRAMYHDYFNSWMLSSKNGGDNRVYGGAGVTFKF